jgi:hypothetical protein
MTHSIGVFKPSGLPRRVVNLQMNEYTKSVSHLSDGCVAFDGGHTWPFLSSGAAVVAGMAPKREEETRNE